MSCHLQISHLFQSSLIYNNSQTIKPNLSPIYQVNLKAKMGALGMMTEIFLEEDPEKGSQAGEGVLLHFLQPTPALSFNSEV